MKAQCVLANKPGCIGKSMRKTYQPHTCFLLRTQLACTAGMGTACDGNQYRQGERQYTEHTNCIYAYHRRKQWYKNLYFFVANCLYFC